MYDEWRVRNRTHGCCFIPVIGLKNCNNTDAKGLITPGHCSYWPVRARWRQSGHTAIELLIDRRMERESNQLEAGPILCRTGCGFFGSPNTDGLCSKCYKDALKKKQQPPSTVPSPTATTAAASASPAPPSTNSSTTTTLQATATTAQPTVPSLSQADASSGSPEKSCPDVSACGEDVDSSSPDQDGAKKKKNKCHMCKKKVGLTGPSLAGFACRCGGLFCSVHRYSNEHRCTFDYREHGAEEIRRNNPVIKGEKIQKI
ncbi:uncharacterized protein LOC143020303 isoform X1 [Oratosquilla oratoria]|uniref:uncharacterized protein LOC143020303 isoform X1 n=1 Tax=Oratosquilla oratoria TaxID=337810 RepID=UPI003F768239